MKTATIALTGLLALAATSAIAKNFIGGEIYSAEKVKYGRWEIRMQMPRLGGAVSSFFTYEPDSWMGGDHPWREIDIEYLGNKNTGFQSNIITGAAEKKFTSEKFHTTVGDPGSGFHTYGLEWTPDSVSWFFDGKLLRTTKATNSDQVGDMQDLPQTYRMNLWASTSTAWVGSFDSTHLPAYQVIKYMKYSTYTPGAGLNGSNFTPAWTDSFATFDNKRWAKGDWTFDENYVDFKASNILVKDKHLILCLTDADHPGLVGSFPHDTATSTGISTSRNLSSLNVRSAAEGLDVQIPDGAGDWQLRVHDSAGKLLASRSGHGNGNVQLPLAGKGLRLVSLVTQDTRLQQRIIQ